jgi:hypothetical protein
MQGRKAASYEEIAEELWPNFNSMPISWKRIVWAYIHALRREGWHIEVYRTGSTQRGGGYQLIGRKKARLPQGPRAKSMVCREATRHI